MPSYPYSALGDGVPRPYLLVWRDPRVPFAAIVDSGADGSCLPIPLAAELGASWDPGKPKTAIGAGGPYQYWEALEDIELIADCGPIRLAKPSLNPGLPFILLGRRDMFRSFRIRFDERGQLFDVEPYT